MVVVLGPNSHHLLSREICYKGYQQQQSLSGELGCSTSSVSVPRSAAFCTGRRWWSSGRRRVVEAGAFWQDVSKPASVEMEAIKDNEQLDEILRRAQEEDQPHSIVIDWMAAWCRKCIYLKPKLEKLAADYPKVKFYYVDVNNVSQTLVKRGNISKMPTIQLWKDGEIRAEVIGGHKAWLVVEEVREMIQKHM